MLCPECNHELLPITLKSEMYTLGGKIRETIPQEVVLDYCGNCGGVWSDQGEVNFISGRNIGPLLSLLPKNPTPTQADYRFLTCPKDREPLRFFQRESVPRHISLLRCQRCSGIWFPQNSVGEFKQAQEAKINYFKTWNIPLHSVYAVLLPILIFAIVGGGIVATLVGTRQQTDLRSRAAAVISRPLVVAPRDTEILISFTTSFPAVTKIRYWQESDKMTEVWVAKEAAIRHSILVKNLRPRAEVTYQIEVVTDPPLRSPVYHYAFK